MNTDDVKEPLKKLRSLQTGVPFTSGNPLRLATYPASSWFQKPTCYFGGMKSFGRYQTPGLPP
jgi:hypothetical protein